MWLSFVGSHSLVSDFQLSALHRSPTTDMPWDDRRTFLLRLINLTPFLELSSQLSHDLALTNCQICSSRQLRVWNFFKTWPLGDMGVRGLTRGLATFPPRCNQEPLLVKDNDWRPPGEHPGSALCIVVCLGVRALWNVNFLTVLAYPGF